MSKTSEIHIRMPEELHASVKNLADESGVSVNAWVVDLLRLMVDGRKILVRLVEDPQKETDENEVYEIYVPEDWFAGDSPTS